MSDRQCVAIAGLHPPHVCPHVTNVTVPERLPKTIDVGMLAHGGAAKVERHQGLPLQHAVHSQVAHHRRLIKSPSPPEFLHASMTLVDPAKNEQGSIKNKPARHGLANKAHNLHKQDDCL